MQAKEKLSADWFLIDQTLGFCSLDKSSLELETPEERTIGIKYAKRAEGFLYTHQIISDTKEYSPYHSFDKGDLIFQSAVYIDVESNPKRLDEIKANSDFQWEAKRNDKLTAIGLES